MHPAHEVAARLHHKVVAIVAEPCRHRDTHAWPLVAGALGIAVHHQHAVVEPYLALAKLSLTEACAHRRTVCLGAVLLLQVCLNRIEVAVAP